MNTLVENFRKSLVSAIEKYGSDKIDVICDEDTNCLDIMYHDKHNSFGVNTDSLDISIIEDGKEFINMLDEHGVGYDSDLYDQLINIGLKKV